MAIHADESMAVDPVTGVPALLKRQIMENRMEAEKTLSTLYESFNKNINAFALSESHYTRSVDNDVYWGYETHHDLTARKCLPYRDIQKLNELHETGRKMFHTSKSCRGAIESLISYIVGSGFSYNVKIKKSSKKVSSATKNRRDKNQDIINTWIEDHNWHDQTEELVKRYCREGDVLRRMDFEKGPRVKFEEPFRLKKPKLTDGEKDHRTAEYGVEYDDFGDVEAFHMDLRRFMTSGSDVATEVDPVSYQYIKQGVDKGDPRGIPLFAGAFNTLYRIDRLEAAITDLAIIQASVALIRKHMDTTSGESLAEFGSRAESSMKDTIGQVKSGMILDAKSFDFEFPTQNINSESLLAVLAQLQRLAGSVANMPSFLITGNAGDSNFSSTIAAEGPFTRRIEREQAWIARSDRIFFYRILAWHLSGSTDIEELDMVAKGIRKEFDIEVIPPPIVSRDAAKDWEVTKSKIETGVESIKNVIESSGGDYDQIQDERQEHMSSYEELHVDPSIKYQVENAPEPVAGATGTGINSKGKGSVKTGPTNNPRNRGN